MSTELVERNNVISLLEASVKGQKQTSDTLLVMFEAIKHSANTAQEAAEIAKSASDKAQSASHSVDLAVNRVEVIAERIDNSVWLGPGETGKLQEAVRERSIILAKMNQVPDEEFKTTVGKIRHKVWRKMNQHFGTSKYIYIRQVDFQDALEFALGFSLIE